MPIRSLSELDLNQTYTYADYLSWQIKERIELLKGKIQLMSPAPNMQHQRISSNLHGILWTFLKAHHCQVFSAPFDVRLSPKSKPSSEDEKVYTVVQPDLCVICDPSKLDEKGCIGAPELVIEILSPGNSHREMREKFTLYEEAGVLEYWIVSPMQSDLLRYVRNEEGVFIGKQPLTNQDQVETPLLPGLVVELGEVFGE
jgi:Uma2 family endonuclease